MVWSAGTHEVARVDADVRVGVWPGAACGEGGGQSAAAAPAAADRLGRSTAEPLLKPLPPVTRAAAAADVGRRGRVLGLAALCAATACGQRAGRRSGV